MKPSKGSSPPPASFQHSNVIEHRQISQRVLHAPKSVWCMKCEQKTHPHGSGLYTNIHIFVIKHVTVFVRHSLTCSIHLEIINNPQPGWSYPKWVWKALSQSKPHIYRVQSEFTAFLGQEFQPAGVKHQLNAVNAEYFQNNQSYCPNKHHPPGCIFPAAISLCFPWFSFSRDARGGLPCWHRL